ncbi:MAG: hypothetical protein J6U40_07495, partial [Kiritimatiellae bacterium]|nr:hypothetical protein [Kiritimatiellia bacterium]
MKKNNTINIIIATFVLTVGMVGNLQAHPGHHHHNGVGEVIAGVTGFIAGAITGALAAPVEAVAQV